MERPEYAGLHLQEILNRTVLFLKRNWFSPHYLPNRGLAETLTIDNEKGVESPQSPSVIPVWFDLGNPALGPLYSVCVLREGS